jgi:hypothetical protein
MRKFLPFVFLISLLAGCNLPHATPTPTTAPTALPYTQCAWNWATQGLPDLSAEVQSALEAAGLKNVTARAEAFGENCINQDGTVDHFAAMETDFRLTAQVDNLADTEQLGNLLERILVVLDGFPAGTTPGTQPGYVGVAFQAGSDTSNLWFLITDGEAARAQDLHGAALLDRLTNK